MMRDKLFPKLRFPEFRGKPGWKVLPLSHFVQSLDAGVSANSGDGSAGSEQLGILKTSAVTGGAFRPNENKVVLGEDEQARLTEPVIADTIIISRMNTPALVGANAYVRAGMPNLFLPDRLWAAKPKPHVSMRFLAFVLGSDKGRAALRQLATGTSGSMKNITKPEVLKLPIAAPAYVEQKMIAECLGTLDELIEGESQKLDALKVHKKGLVQQLIPREGETLPRYRFPEFQKSGAWRERKISDVLMREAIPVDVAQDEDYREIGVRSHGKGVFHKPATVGAAIGEKRVFRVVENALVLNIVFAWEQAIATTSDGEVGMIASHRFPMYVPRAKECDVRFVKYCFLTPWGKHLLGLASPGGAGRNRTLGRSEFEELKLVCPDIDEQTRIADVLDAAQSLVAIQAKRLEALKAHKQGLMQQLFPVLDPVGA